MSFTVEELQYDPCYRYEVFAPEGFQFAGGEHSLLCHTKKEVNEMKKGEKTQYAVYPCPDDCDCRETL